MVPIPAAACLSRWYRLDAPSAPVQAQVQGFTTLAFDGDMTKGFDVSCNNRPPARTSGIWAPTGPWRRTVPTSVSRTPMYAAGAAGHCHGLAIVLRVHAPCLR